MAQSIASLGKTSDHQLSLNIKSVGLTNEQLHRLCSDNPELKFEVTAEGELIVMSPTGSKTGIRNSKLTTRLLNWAETDGTGVCFDSSTLFALPNGAKRSPDASWIHLDRWNALSENEQEDFAPICPDFVVELRSKSDRLKPLQKKMAEYIKNGAQLGWLIDPENRRVHIYRPNQDVEILDNPDSLNGETVLPGFVLNLSDIW
ncbi:MAG: Uma2 family endonuclease [Acidobacteriota bacterium]